MFTVEHPKPCKTAPQRNHYEERAPYMYLMAGIQIPVAMTRVTHNLVDAAR